MIHPLAITTSTCHTDLRISTQWGINSIVWCREELQVELWFCFTQHCCCFSVQGLHPVKDPTFVDFEGEFLGETLLTVVKCDSLAFGAFPGCITRCFTRMSWFLPPRPAKVTIYATWCRHFLSFSYFSGAQRILGYVRPRRIVKREKKAAFVGCIWRSLRMRTAFVWRCDIIGVQMLIWRMQTVNWDTANVRQDISQHHVKWKTTNNLQVWFNRFCNYGIFIKFPLFFFIYSVLYPCCFVFVLHLLHQSRKYNVP